MTETRKLRVFLCHASQDKPIVRELYQRLNAEGWIDPWVDEEKLLPGQEWAAEIPQAVRDADVVIVCISKKSVTKEGYVQKEISYALDIADEKPEGTIYIIPVLLEECQVPGRLRRWQYLDYNKEKSYEKLLLSLKYRADRLQSIPLFEELRSAPPIEEILTSYVFGDDLYDEVFGINSLSGEVLGEFGIAISETFGNDAPKKVIAFEVWLRENEEAITDGKFFLSTRAYYDPIVRKKLYTRGELVLIEPKKQILLETEILQLLVTVVDFEYEKNIYPSSTCFERATFELVIYPKL
jgi:hypothetical protein